jgi:hypothetical protein
VTKPRRITKPITLRLHYSKQGAFKGKPWTVHCSQGCFGATHVEMHGTFQTEENPNKASNPRYFIKCFGTFHYEGKTLIVRSVGAQTT